jgi:F-type H+-transporting ATPase subunit b
MRSRKSCAIVLAVLPLLLFMSAEASGKPSATMDFLGKVVNFAVLFGGLAFVARKPLAAMLRKKSADVRDAIRLADESVAGASRKRTESAARLAGVEKDVLRMKAEAEADAGGAKDRIARLAEEESARIRQFTAQEIDERRRGGVRELKAYAAEKATALAGERIRKKLTPESQAALIDKSIERLAKLHEKPYPRP